MNIAVIGKGKVGTALINGWILAGHRVVAGVREPEAAKWESSPAPSMASVEEAAGSAEVIVVAVPAPASGPLGKSLAGVSGMSGRLIIDATNSIFQRPEGFESSYQALQSQTGADVVKCFNCTGAENMASPRYPEGALDMFMAGGSEENQQVVRRLAMDLGFAECYSAGGPEAAPLLENFAALWIRLSQKQSGRHFGFRLVSR
jgi:predicted dinucleotide-binding enzyme